MGARGPLVPRAARRAAGLLLLAVLEFTAAMAIAQARFPGYSDVSNAISDLGNSAKSPGYLVFNVSIIVFGLIGIVATWLLRAAFRPKSSPRIGLALLGIAFVGSIAVGLFPEEVRPTVHSLAAAVTFLGAGLALLFLALGMLRDTRWDGMRLYTAVSGAVTLGAIGVLFSSLTNSGNFGLIERIVVAPGLLWMAVASIHLARLPVYDPGALAHPTI
jgi:hypothetical membrane protein